MSQPSERVIAITAQEADQIYNNLDAITRSGVAAHVTQNAAMILSILTRANNKSLEDQKKAES